MKGSVVLLCWGLAVLNMLGCATRSKVIYETDLASDPGWTTNDPAQIYWNSASSTYHGRQANTNTSYVYVPVSFPSSDSWRLEFDCLIDSCAWSAGLTFGLWDESMKLGVGSYMVADHSVVDQGCVTHATHCQSQVSGWSTGVWYTNAIEYDADRGTVSLDVRNRETGTTLCSLSASGVTLPAGLNRLGASRLHMEGYNTREVSWAIDNVRLVLTAKCHRRGKK